MVPRSCVPSVTMAGRFSETRPAMGPLTEKANTLKEAGSGRRTVCVKNPVGGLKAPGDGFYVMKLYLHRVVASGMDGRRWIAPAMGLALLVAFSLLPPLDPLTPMGMRTVGLFLCLIVWWVSLGVDLPSLMSVVLVAVLGILPPGEAFAAAFGNWVVFFVLGCFGLSEGLRRTGFPRRFALWFLNRPSAAGSPWRLVGLFLLGCTVMGTVMSSTVVAIVFMTIGATLLRELGYEKGDRFAAMLMMGVAWAATASTATTPIAHVGNIVMIEWVWRDLAYNISFPQWMIVGLPTGLISYALMFGFLRVVVGGDTSRFTPAIYLTLKREHESLGPITRREKAALGVFGAVVVTWILPGTIDHILPTLAGYLLHVGYAVPALAGAVLMCFISVEGEPLLSFEEWMNKGVKWGTIFLVSAIMLLGDVVGNPDTGITQFLIGLFQPLVEGTSSISVVFLAVSWVTLQTNVLSNLVSQTLVYNITVPVVEATGLGNPVALAVTIAAAAKYAFVLPSATIAAALVAGSGWVPMRFMIRYGLLLIVPIILAFTVIYYPLASLVFR